MRREHKPYFNGGNTVTDHLIDTIDHLPAIPCTLNTASDWDYDVYARAFTESPANQLRSCKNSPRLVLYTAARQPEFVQTVIKIAADDLVEPSDVILSLHRTLSYYVSLD